MGCLFSLPNAQQQKAKTILAGGFNSEFHDEQVSPYWPSDMEIERLRIKDQRRNYESDSVHSANQEAVTKDASYRPAWRSNPGNFSPESCEVRPELVNNHMWATRSILSGESRLSNTYSQIYHRRISSRLSETRTEHSYLVRHNDASFLVAAGKPRDMPSLLAASKKKATLIRTFKKPRMNSQRQFCSDSEMNLSDIPSDTADDQPPRIISWRTRDMPSMLASSKKKPTHLRSLKRPKRSSQKLLSSDSEMNWSDIQSETADDQPQPRYVLRPSVNQRSQSSPKSQFAAQHAIDESGTHSPPSVMINNNNAGWTDLPQLHTKANTIWPPAPSGCLSTISVKLTGSDAEQYHDPTEKRSPHNKGLTVYDQISQHLAPLLNEDGHISPHLTEGSDYVAPCRSQYRSQTMQNQLQQYLEDDAAYINRSHIDEFSLHSKEHGGDILICMQ